MEIVNIRNKVNLYLSAAQFFNSAFNIPIETYLESFKESENATIPQWFVAIYDNKVIGGIGVIENDFHPRTDLSPNICAFIVDEYFRNQGIGRKLFEKILKYCFDLGYNQVYLITNHTSLYEKYGGVFYTQINEDRCYLFRKKD